MATSSILKNLTMEQIKEAFEKARSEVNIQGVRLQLITEEHYDTALKFVREHFMLEEPISKAVGMEWTDELEAFWLASFKLNLSFMLVDEETGDMIALRTTKITCKDDSIDLNSIQTKPLKELLDYCIYCDTQADFFGHFGITEAFHFFGIAVNKKYSCRGKHIAAQLFLATISMIRHFGIDPIYIKGEGTSNFSKKVFERSGFEILYEKPFDSWEVDGKRTIQNTGIHTSMKVYGLKVTQSD